MSSLFKFIVEMLQVFGKYLRRRVKRRVHISEKANITE